MSLASQVLFGLLLGVASGVFFGEIIAPIGIVGDAFVMFMQMTVLPYVVVSLILGLGQLKSRGVGRLIRYATSLLFILWIVALFFVVLMPLAYPDWESASYFSTSLLNPPPDLDYLKLFIPANPFNSMATGVVPATVVFSLALGASLIGIGNKQSLIEGLSILSTALSRITRFAVRFAPVGVFAITARAAGTLNIHELKSLEVYIATYFVFWLIMGFWFLPMLITSLTPLKYRDVMGPSRDALLTAFATGSVFVVLPILAEHSKKLVKRCAPDFEDASKAVDVLIPLAFTFPGPGTLLILGFIPFAAWTAGLQIASSDIPLFLSTGLMSLFGSTMVAIPFLLDQLRIPADLFHFYIVSDVFTARFGMFLSGVYTLVFSSLAACGLAGKIQIRKGKLLVMFLGMLVLLLVGVKSINLCFNHFVTHEYAGGQHYLDRELIMSSVQHRQSEVRFDQETTVISLNQIISRGTIRVGYSSDVLPFAFRNSSDHLVGHDIDLAHVLASDLGVQLELIPVKRGDMAGLLSNGSIDIMLSGLAVTSERAALMEFTNSYIDQTLAFVVLDHRRNEFSTRKALKKRRGLLVAVPDISYLKEKVTAYLNEPDIKIIESPR
jgi:Na+/H+-dicarboxylate symporter/ABC-type amino acid transport substrate-binding protein